MKTIFKILSLCLLPLFLASCSSKMIQIDERTQNKPNEVVDDNNAGTNPKFLDNEQYVRTPQENDIGHCEVSFQGDNRGQASVIDELSSKSTYDQCLDIAGDKLYQTNSALAKVHFARADGTSIDKVISKP